MYIVFYSWLYCFVVVFHCFVFNCFVIILERRHKHLEKKLCKSLFRPTKPCLHDVLCFFYIVICFCCYFVLLLFVFIDFLLLVDAFVCVFIFAYCVCLLLFMFYCCLLFFFVIILFIVVYCFGGAPQTLRTKYPKACFEQPNLASMMFACFVYLLLLLFGLWEFYVRALRASSMYEFY